MEIKLGIGLFGEEGTQAAMAADYACGEFKCLRRLLLFHGRLNYLRIAEMILYFFFKNFMFTIPQFYFAFFSCFSGQTWYDDWFVSLYNIFFTSTPLLFKALFERDFVDPEQLEEKTTDDNFFNRNLPYAYYVGRESLIFNLKNLSWDIFLSFSYSVLVYFWTNYCIVNSIEQNGNIPDYWVLSLTQFTSIILVYIINKDSKL
jgi:magnesium-transporting ATPase (P-type)